MLELELPLKDIFVNQPFGVNYVDFYTKLGMKGHNGIDFKAKDGCECYAAHTGIVTRAGKDSGGGVFIEITNILTGYKTIYYHLKSVTVKKGQTIGVGELIGYCDNTGKYTTGDHLHFGLKEVDVNGRTINVNNGYNGAIDPAPYFKKNWDKSNSYHRYGKERNWFAEFCLRFAPISFNNQWTKSGRWVHKRMISIGMKPTLTSEQVNAVIYGAWDFESIINPAMFTNYAYLTKEEYLKGKRPFC